MRKVELKLAYSWVCDDCGTTNFVEPRLAELTDEDAEQAFRKYHGIDDWCEIPIDWRDFELVGIPDFVVCTKCGSQFKAIDETRA